MHTITDDNGINYIFHFHDSLVDQILNEAQYTGTHLTGTYSYNKHQPHNPTGEYHLHVYRRGKEIFAINQSGSPHDGCSGARIPNKVYDSITKKFPDWNWPSSQIIESQYLQTEGQGFKNNLRKVKVTKHVLLSEEIPALEGFFHRYADYPRFINNREGWIVITVALIEAENGQVWKALPDQIRFVSESSSIKLND